MGDLQVFQDKVLIKSKDSVPIGELNFQPVKLFDKGKYKVIV